VLLAIVPYLNTLDNDFVLDDVPIVQQNSRIRRLEDAGALFTTDYWHGAVAPGVATDPGLYRPLTMASFALNYQVSRQSPRGYHAANIAIHAGVSLVVFHVATMLVASPVAALGAAAVFAVHPMHTDAVSGIVGRAELLATLFFLLAFALSVPRRSTEGVIELPTLLRSAAAAALYLLAVLAKESAATLPLVVLLYDWLHRHELPADRPRVIRAGVIRYGFLGIAAAIYLGLRAQAVTQSAAPWIGFIGVSTVDRFLITPIARQIA